MPIQQLSAADFNGARAIDWFGPANTAGDPANLAPNAYADAAGTIARNFALPAATEGVDAFLAKRAPAWKS